MSIHSLFRSFFTLLLAAILLVACSSQQDIAPAPVKIAEPIPYKATADDQLGINENGKGLAPGQQIADIQLRDIHGEAYSLADAWQEKPALIVFYRGGWCPYCNMQVRELSENYQTLAAAGVQPVLISVDAPDNTAMLSATYQIPFPVLSDSDLLAHKQFNVLLQVDAEKRKQYEEYGFDLADWSGRQHYAIAVASVFLIDSQGRVLMSHALADYSQRPSIEQLLQMIDRYVP